MAKDLRLRTASESEIDLMKNRITELLEKRGLRIDHPELLSYVKKAGGDVDEKIEAAFKLYVVVCFRGFRTSLVYSLALLSTYLLIYLPTHSLIYLPIHSLPPHPSTYSLNAYTTQHQSQL